MTRPELSPGEGGGIPAKPQLDLPWYYSLILQAPTTETSDDEGASVSTPTQPTQTSTPSKPLNPDRSSSRPSTTKRPQPILVPPDVLDISEDAIGSLEQHIAALYDGQPIAGSARPIEQAPAPVTDEFGYTPLTPGQEMDVDYLLSFVIDTLARDVLITMKRDGIPPRSQRKEFMSPHAEWGWDATSDALA